MADKNVKVELNVENLEGVAGGANQSFIEKVDGARNPWHEDDEPSVANPPEDDGKKSKSNKGKIKF